MCGCVFLEFLVLAPVSVLSGFNRSSYMFVQPVWDCKQTTSNTPECNLQNGWWIWSSYQNRSEFRRICTKYQSIVSSLRLDLYRQGNWYTDILHIIHQVRSHRNNCAARGSTQIAIFDGDVSSFEHVQNPTCLVLEFWFGFGNSHMFLGRRKKYLKAVQKTGTCLVPGRWLYPILDINHLEHHPFLLFSKNNIWNHQPVYNGCVFVL
jgi:hypothetical protein